MAEPLNTPNKLNNVSIQLVSPARGEGTVDPLAQEFNALRFHSIGFPCERGDGHDRSKQHQVLLGSVYQRNSQQ